MKKCFIHFDVLMKIGWRYGWFSIERGVRQGCILSPWLFNTYSERIMRDVKAEFEGGVQIGGERLNNLRFAGDAVLLCNNKEELTDMIQLVRDKSAKRGLLLNVKKTKILVVDSNREDTSAFKINGEEIEEVDDFIYLGPWVDNKKQGQ